MQEQQQSEIIPEDIITDLCIVEDLLSQRRQEELFQVNENAQTKKCYFVYKLSESPNEIVVLISNETSRVYSCAKCSLYINQQFRSELFIESDSVRQFILRDIAQGSIITVKLEPSWMQWIRGGAVPIRVGIYCK